MKTIRQKNLQWLWLTLFVILLDQLTKYFVYSQFQLGESKSVASYLNIVLAYNRGAAFSFLNDAGGWQLWLFGMIAVLVSVVLMVMLFRAKIYDRFTAIGFSLIVGGALGNLIDRIIHGHVIDFIDFHINTWHWPAFNVADSSVCMGATLLIVIQIFGSSK